MGNSTEGSNEEDNGSNEEEEEDRCKDISNNKVNFPNIGRVRARANRTCKWFREKYKNKVLKKKYCLRKALITSGQEKEERLDSTRSVERHVRILDVPIQSFVPKTR